MKRKTKKANGSIALADDMLVRMRMQAIEIAARLPEPEPGVPGGMMGGMISGRPGKSADKVIADAQKIVDFATKP